MKREHDEEPLVRENGRPRVRNLLPPFVSARRSPRSTATFFAVLTQFFPAPRPFLTFQHLFLKRCLRAMRCKLGSPPAISCPGLIPHFKKRPPEAQTGRRALQKARRKRKRESSHIFQSQHLEASSGERLIAPLLLRRSALLLLIFVLLTSAPVHPETTANRPDPYIAAVFILTTVLTMLL